MRNFVASIVGLIVCLSAVTDSMGQNIDLVRAEGYVIARGVNSQPVKGKEFELKSYRVELIPDYSSTMDKATRKYPSYKGIRLILTGNFPSGNYVVWLNGASHLATIAPTGELYLIWGTSQMRFESGLEIAVGSSYREAVKLPEEFLLPDEFLAPKRSEQELREAVSITSATCDATKPGGSDACVRVSILRNPYVVGTDVTETNHMWYLQIGESVFLGGAGEFVITRKQFENLNNGDWVVIKTADGPFGGASVGKLDKSRLKD